MVITGGNLRSRSAVSGGSSVLGLFLLLNVAPIAGVAYAAFKWTRGELPLDRIPRGMGAHIGAIAVAILLLFVFARWSLPVVHRVVKFAEGGMSLRRQVMDRDAKGNPVRAALALPFYWLLWIVAYPVRFVLMTISFVLIAVVVVGLVRFYDPNFAAAWGVPVLMTSRGG